MVLDIVYKAKSKSLGSITIVFIRISSIDFKNETHVKSRIEDIFREASKILGKHIVIIVDPINLKKTFKATVTKCLKKVSEKIFNMENIDSIFVYVMNDMQKPKVAKIKEEKLEKEKIEYLKELAYYIASVFNTDKKFSEKINEIESYIKFIIDQYREIQPFIRFITRYKQLIPSNMITIRVPKSAPKSAKYRKLPHRIIITEIRDIFDIEDVRGVHFNEGKGNDIIWEASKSRILPPDIAKKISEEESHYEFT